MKNRLLLVCLLFSGFAGLAYELMWTRLLSFSFGSTTLSFSTVLAVFFGGLAFGAYLGGRKSARLGTNSRPLRLYAMIELGCGVAGLVLYPLLKNLGELFAAFDPGPNLFGLFVRFAVAAPLLLIPTLLMGATLPIVCAGMIERDDEIGRGSALIYGLNTLGACLGAYLVTYHLLPALGVFGTNMTAVAANLIAGAGALLIERSGSHTRIVRPAISSTETNPELRKFVAVAAVLTGLGGFAAISLQIVWIRVFTAILDGTIYGIGAVLISVLIGIALGSIFIARTLKTSRHPALWFVALQLATMFAVLWFASNLNWIDYVLRYLALSKSTPLRNLHAQLLGTFLILLIPTFASGASLPLLLQIAERRAENTGRSLGVLYAANTAGSILGSLLTGFITVPEAGSEATLFVTLVALAATAAIAAVLLGGTQLRVVRLVLAGAALLLLSRYDGIDVRALSNTRPNKALTYDQWEDQARANIKRLRFFAEGEHGTVVVNESPSGRSLVLNGLGQGNRLSAPPHYVLESVLVAYVPFVHARATDKAMVVGLGAGATMDLLAKFGVGKVRVLELEARVIDAVERIYEPENPLKSDRVEVLLNDARHQLLLEKNKGGGEYDMIASMPAHPWVASSIFTREFFELAKANLRNGGVFCTWFGSGKMDDVAVKSLLRAFVDVFPYYAVYWVESVGAYYLVGGRDSLTLDLGRVAELQENSYIRLLPFFKNPRALALTTYASGTPRTPAPPKGVVNTDDSAFVETHAPRSSTRAPILSEFMPREYLLPDLISADRRGEFYDLYLEDLLADQSRLRRAKRTFDEVKPLLAPEASAYFSGRLALAEGRRNQAQQHFQEAGSARGQKYLALVLPAGSEEQLAALEALPPATDILLLLLEHDRARALAKLRDKSPPDPDRDATRWLLYTFKNGAAVDGEQERTIFRTKVGPLLQDSSSRALLALAAELAETRGLEEEARFCRTKIDQLDRARATQLIQAGTRAGASGNFREAADLLGRALLLAPGDRQAQSLRVRALVETGDRAELDEQLEQLRFYGVSDEYLKWLVREAQDKKLGDDFSEEESAPQ